MYYIYTHIINPPHLFFYDLGLYYLILSYSTSFNLILGYPALSPPVIFYSFLIYPFVLPI